MLSEPEKIAQEHDLRLVRGARLTMPDGVVYVVPEHVMGATLTFQVPGSAPVVITVDTVWAEYGYAK